ncbi:MAG: DUF4097 family beta strand repeat protein [Pseudomonadales bacterium]|nr:DUF4097 family beta strand repeat protein [Pseudomonadales bacterium]
MNIRNFSRRIFAVSTFVALVPVALAEGESVDMTQDVQSEGLVSINVVRGRVSVEAWDKSAVRVHGTLDEKTKEFIFEVDGDETQIEVKIDNDRDSWWGGGSQGSDLTVQLPAMSLLEVKGVSTDVDVQGMESDVDIGAVSGDLNLVGGKGRVTVQSVSGDVDVRDVTGRLRIGTVSGDVDTQGINGEAKYTSVSGSILIRDGGDHMSVETVSGDIEVSNDLVNSVAGHSVSGDIEVISQETGLGDIEFDSVSGSIRLRLGGDINARFDIETGSGAIRNRLSKDKPKVSKYVGDESLRFTMGNGDGSVVLSTRSGDINLSAN